MPTPKAAQSEHVKTVENTKRNKKTNDNILRRKLAQMAQQGIGSASASASATAPPQPVETARKEAGGRTNIPGLDKGLAAKFRKGELPLEAVLDLHGLTQEVAFDTLLRFIKDAYTRQKRMLLVITGKGRDAPHTPGILKEALPAWLSHPEIRSLILASCEAQPVHGGTGAYYLLLKRQRKH